MQDYSRMSANLRMLSRMFAQNDAVCDELYLASIAIDDLQTELKQCRNELCLRCGQYKERHKGACDGCRWRDM